MTRVAFIPQPWLGGLNYLRNLLTALHATPGVGIEPVLVHGDRMALPDDVELGKVERVATPLLQRPDPRWLGRVLLRRTWGRDPFLVRTLARSRVDLLSHSGDLGSRAAIPCLTWIADFQHRHYPALFGARERAERNAAFRSWCAHGARVVVSSDAARRDLATFHPEHAHKARVLRFVDCSSPVVRPTPPDELERRYGFRGPYFLLPNQFWIHKNHRVVVAALGRLRSMGRGVVVLCTGATDDYRQPGYFRALVEEVAAAGVAESFRVLGRIPYADLGSLMRGATAVLNPSLFEGWSTTVEEAKSLGKQVIVSDIPVHREQAAARARYFDPADPEALAAALWDAWTSFDPGREPEWAARAAAELPERRARFAREYAAIVREIVSR